MKSVKSMMLVGLLGIGLMSSTFTHSAGKRSFNYGAQLALYATFSAISLANTFKCLSLSNPTTQHKAAGFFSGLSALLFSGCAAYCYKKAIGN